MNGRLPELLRAQPNGAKADRGEHRQAAEATPQALNLMLQFNIINLVTLRRCGSIRPVAPELEGLFCQSCGWRLATGGGKFLSMIVVPPASVQEIQPKECCRR